MKTLKEFTLNESASQVLKELSDLKTDMKTYNNTMADEIAKLKPTKKAALAKAAALITSTMTRIANGDKM